MKISLLIKRLTNGTIPYFCTSIFKPGSNYLKYYRYIHQRGYSRFVFGFEHEYINFPVTVFKDEEKDLHYVLHDNKRLYIKRGLEIRKIQGIYRALLLEQDVRSPHHYLDNLEEAKGRIFVDIGSAEGFTSLEVADEATHIYLFEKDPDWLEALQATFEPWKEKVTITRKYVSDSCDDENITLDDFFKDITYDNLFLKMDIEGAERHALNGSKTLFSQSNNLRFAICTYHLLDDEEIITRFLDSYNCSYINQKGYYKRRICSFVLRGDKSTS